MKRLEWSSYSPGTKSQFVPVRHGSSCFRAHPCQLIKTYKQELSVINGNETSERIPGANRDGELRMSNLKYKQANSNTEVHEDVYAADEDVENVVENVEDDDKADQLQSVSWILAQFYFNRGLQRLYTGTCIILQKNN